MTVVLVMIPFRCPSRMPRVTPSVRLKSSAFTIRYFATRYSLGAVTR